MSHRPPSAPVPRARRSGRALRTHALSLLAATTVLGAAASTAQAATFTEVVTRATGVAGAAPSRLFAIPGAVSADGMFSAYSMDPTGIGFGYDGLSIPDVYLYVRNIATNQTLKVTKQGWTTAADFDASGRYLAYNTLTYHRNANNNIDTSTFALLDTSTMKSKIVGRASGVDGALAEGAFGTISGDGKSVVFTATNVPGLGDGLFRRDLQTNVTTRLGDRPAYPVVTGEPADLTAVNSSITSVSDDGKVIGLSNRTNDRALPGLIVTPTGRTATNGLPYVSADGTTAAYFSPSTSDEYSPGKLVLRTIAAGAETSAPAPKDPNGNPYYATYASVSWISPDGKQVAVGPSPNAFTSGPVYDEPAQLYDRTSNAYSAAGPFAANLTQASPGIFGFSHNQAVSRTGRYVLFPPRTTESYWFGFDRVKVLVVGDNWNQGLPGGTDLPPASAYFQQSLNGGGCNTTAAFLVNPAPRFLPAATSVKGTVRVNGQILGEDTYTQRTEYIQVPFPKGTRTVQATVTANYADGRSVTGTYDVQVQGSQC